MPLPEGARNVLHPFFGYGIIPMSRYAIQSKRYVRVVRSMYVDKKVTFAAGDLTLEGRIWLATGSRDVGVVLCHPHPLRGGNMYSNVVSAVAEALWTHDVSTLRFNFRGTGASTGSHGDGDTEGADVAAAVAYLLSCQPTARLVVAGYSFGAGVGLLAGAADARVTALVGIAPPVARRDMSPLHTCTKAKLFVTGDKDHVCPVPVLEDLIAHCPEPKALALIPGADHFFLGRELEVAEAVVTFVAQ